MYKFLFPVALLFLSSCSFEMHHPPEPYLGYQPPVKPDYAVMDTWAAHPDKIDPADRTPHGDFIDQQKTAEVDVFYIHPTTLNSEKRWNAGVGDEKINKITDNLPLKHQASIFNGSARVFAPRYRQSTLGAFYKSMDDKEFVGQTFEVSYSDVKAAFEYYLEHHNNGRPIIIAGHSQGSFHGMHILKEFFDGTELQAKLVAAYLPGFPIQKDYLTHIPACESPDQNRCLNSWNTYHWDVTPKYAEHFKNTVVTNPLNWSSDGTKAGLQCSKGAVLRKYNKVYSKICAAQQHEGWLWITTPKVPSLLLKKMTNFHIADYNLFWVNVRENVAERVAAFSEEEPQIFTGK